MFGIYTAYTYASGRPGAQRSGTSFLPVIQGGGNTANNGSGGTLTVGRAQTSTNAAPTTACSSGIAPNFNPAYNGVITATDGSTWTVPAPVTDGAVATDLYNDCTGAGDNPDYATQLKTVVVDADGVEITGYLFADNYYELYVNGKFVARDPIGFTPFNSSVVRFKAKYPITYAVKLVDGETHLGLGLEYADYRVGDGGFIAKFSDGTVTNANWKAETFYIAPLDDGRCVTTAYGHNAAQCPPRPACADSNPESCQALHFPIPANWTTPTFDDTRWPAATTWPAADVTNQPAYTNYTQRFFPASFIWTSNLKLDNLVLARFTAQDPNAPVELTRPSFTLTSPAVVEGGNLPKEYTCDGASSTLPLTWSGAPTNTQSFAVIMHHIPGPGDSHWYWVLYAIPAAVHNLPQNVTGVGILGNNSVNGRTEYAPPCSKGPGPKRYTYTVYALSAPPQLNVPPAEVSRAVLLAAIQDRTLAQAVLNVSYTR